MKEGKYTKSLAKNQVYAIVHMRDIWKNVLPKFIKFCMETPCLCPFQGAQIWPPETNRNICFWVSLLGEQWWRSGESTRLPPMWPGLKSRRRRHMWVEFVAGSLLCSERFFSGYSGFPLSSKSNIFKFQFDQESGRRRTTLWICYLQIVIYLFYLLMRKFFAKVLIKIKAIFILRQGMFR